MHVNYSKSVGRSSWSRNRNFTAHSATAAMGPATTTILLSVIVAVLALLYLTQITKTSVYGFQVNNLTDEHERLVERGQQLEVEAARLRSIANISGRNTVSSLEPESNPQFINP